MEIEKIFEDERNNSGRIRYIFRRMIRLLPTNIQLFTSAFYLVKYSFTRGTVLIQKLNIVLR